jgi:hypothetical protein
LAHLSPRLSFNILQDRTQCCPSYLLQVSAPARVHIRIHVTPAAALNRFTRTIQRHKRGGRYLRILQVSACKEHADIHDCRYCDAVLRSNIAGLARQSTDCGRTWSPPDFVWPEHGLENNIVVTAIESREGEVLVPCDHWGTFDLPSPPILLGDQSVVAHAPSFAQIMNRSAWRRAPSGGGV